MKQYILCTMWLNYLSLSVILMCCNGARILAVYPTPSISHQVPFRPLTQVLAEKGHQVTVITTDPAFSKDETPKNLKEIDVHNCSYNLWSKIFLTVPSVGKNSAFASIEKGFEALVQIFEAEMTSDEVQKLLNDKKFDLLIIEACVRPAIVFSHKYHVPVIYTSSFGVFQGAVEPISGPFHPVLHPDIFQHRLHNLTIWETLNLMWTQYKFQNIITQLEKAENEAGRKVLGSPIPLLSELTNNVNMLFLNMPAFWDNNRPAPPGLVHLGGLPERQEKELPKDLKSYLDSSENGIIYFSLGTNVAPSQIPKVKRDILLKVFSKLPYNVICKWDEDILESSKNILFRRWFPQADLLKHPNIKLFITQGGLQSTDEAISAGVPLLAIPMKADQWFNLEQYAKFGIGSGLDIDTLTEENLAEAIDNVIEDESYSRNILRFRSLVNDKPQSSLDRAVWWTEYLLRHGGKHLRSPAANMPLAEYLELELVFLLLILVLSMILVAVFIVRRICKFMNNIIL